MTTITNNKLTDERVSNATLIRLIQWAEQHNSHYVAAALCELQERRKADSADPAGYHVIKECGKVGCSVATLEEAEKTRDFWNKRWAIKPYFYAPPVQETGVYKGMLNIINLLENNEWSEHCTGTVLGSLLESEITRLVSKEQPVLVVPEEIEPDSNNTYDYVDGWNACRAAMLQGAEPVSQTYELPQTQLEQIADLYEMQFDDGRTCAFHTDGTKAAQWLLACDGNKVQEYVRIERYQEAVIGNSPVTPDGWVIVPKKLTAENGAKGVLSGEFSETTFISCPECFGDDDCDTCDGSGRIEIKVPVTWTTIKSIWDKGIAYFAAEPPQQEVK
ncbi:molecular chaperone DnaJ [Salmonella enterica]|nr:molecular chaperone DnaJ [Salmonella enterica]ECP2368711.1 molecular chaperone DnaJ [Salmonella enterica]EDV5474951.1 molecular chaperone DnaJ [Salmonella enterica subsp. enterica serovar Newport]